MNNKLNIDYLAPLPTSGDANYIGFPLIIKLITWLTLISMGHHLINLCGYIGWGWVRGLKRTGMLALGLLCVAYVDYTLNITSGNNIYRKFIEIMGQNGAPYPTPPKKIWHIAQNPHTGCAPKKNRVFLIGKKLNKNGYQIDFFWLRLKNARLIQARAIA